MTERKQTHVPDEQCVSVALWRPEDFRDKERGKAASWIWLGREENVEEARERYAGWGLELEARYWPSGERWEGA